MAIAYRAGAAANSGITATTTSVSFTVPATAAAGDLAVAWFAANSGSITVTVVPTGWTLLGNPPYAGANPLTQATTLEGWVYRKILVGGDIGATAAWTLSGTARPPGGMQVFSGVDSTTPIEAATSAGAVAATSQNAPAVTSLTAQAWILNLWAGRVASGTIPTITPPAGTHTTPGTGGQVQTNFATSGANLTIAMAYLTTPGAAGSYGAYSAAYAASANGVMFSLALKPAAAAATDPAPAVRRVNRAAVRARVVVEDAFRGINTTEIPQRQPIPIRVSRRGPRRITPRTAGNFVAPPPAQQQTPPAFVPGRQRERVRLAAMARTRLEFVPIPQAAPAPPPLIPQAGTRRTLRGWLTRRARRVAAFPYPDGPPASQRPTRRVPWRVRARRVETVPTAAVAPANPALAPQATARRALRGWLARRAHRVEVVPAQVVVTPPASVPAATQRRAVRGWLARKTRRVEVLPAQAAPTAPALVPRPALRRALRGLPPRRPRRTQAAPPQDRPIAVVARHVRAGATRRLRRIGAALGQAIAVIPSYGEMFHRRPTAPTAEDHATTAPTAGAGSPDSPDADPRGVTGPTMRGL